MGIWALLLIPVLFFTSLVSIGSYLYEKEIQEKIAMARPLLRGTVPKFIARPMQDASGLYSNPKNSCDLGGRNLKSQF